MKATLTFTLPEENEEFEIASKAQRTKGALDEFDHYLRSKLKYEELSEEQHDVYEAVRAKLWELMNE